MRDVIVPFKFAYEVRHTPPKCRYAQSTELEGQSVLSLRQATPPEAPPAFRLCRKDWNGETTQTLEIRSFKNELWWPVVQGNGLVQVSTFLSGLAKGNRYALSFFPGLIPLDGRKLPQHLDLPNARDVNSDYDKMLAVASKQAAEIRLCGDYLYVVGGEPTYVWICDNEKRFELTVLGPPRWSGDTGASWPLGDMLWRRLDPIAYRGHVFRVDEFELAASFMAGRDVRTITLAVVESLSNQKLSIDPLNLQLAALLRSLCQSRLPRSKELLSVPELASIVAKIREIARGDTISTDIGAAALIRFIRWCERQDVDVAPEFHFAHQAGTAAIDAINFSCNLRGLPSPFRFEDAEEAAVASLAE